MQALGLINMRAMRLRHLVLFLAVSALCRLPAAQTDVWSDMLKALGYSETVRARLSNDCRTNTVYATAPRLRALCAKYMDIPDRVIESAALPFAKLHISAELAVKVIEYWGSEAGRALSQKLNAEMESGQNNQLSEDDLEVLRVRNNSDIGLALSALAQDKDMGVAVARVMLAYEP